MDCGEQDSKKLEFDHVRGVKLFNVCQGGPRALAALKREIEKCEVRCSSCHRKRHYKDKTQQFVLLKKASIDEILLELKNRGFNIGK